LAIDVLIDLENVVPFSLDHKALGIFHVHVLFNWGLCIGHDEVNLFGMPALDDGFGEDKANGTPCCCWSIGLPIVASLDLACAIDVEACLPFINLASLNLSFLFHLSDCWEDGGAFWDFGP